MSAHQDYSACRSHTGDPSLLPLVESLKTYFEFFHVKRKPFFGLHRATGTHPDHFLFLYCWCHESYGPMMVVIIRME